MAFYRIHKTMFIFDRAMMTSTPLSRLSLHRHARKLTAWAVLGASLANPAHADRLAGATIARQGAAGITACMACHGPQGEGQAAAGFPRLAGQGQAYLLKQLEDFSGGKRKSPQMEPIARALSAQQRRDVAEHYASLPGWKAEAKPAAAAAQQGHGARLAQAGNWNAGIPACFACHGPEGAGVPPHFPALSGQIKAYTRAQLKAWKTGKRSNDPQGLMKSVADKMSDAEIDAISEYLENPSFYGKRE